MASYSSMASLRSAIDADVRRVMTGLNKDAPARLRKWTSWYYEGSRPKVYQRTYHLRNSPRVSKLTSKGNQFSVWLDESYRYTKGDRPTMLDVINLTNYDMRNSSVGYLDPTIGKRGYWEKALQDIYARAQSAFVAAGYEKV